MVERYNTTLRTQLSLFVAEHQSDWDMVYWMATHLSTHFTLARREIRAPTDLVYERPDPDVVESYSTYVQQLKEHLQVIHEFARKNLEQSFESNRQRYDVIQRR